MTGSCVLAVEDLTVRFDVSPPGVVRLLTRSPRRVVHAVEGLSLEIPAASTFALVGESGCGKSTVARTVAGIERATAGRMVFMGEVLGRERPLALRRHMQMIFQDPFASLDPSWRVGRIIAEPIRTHGLRRGPAIAARVRELLGQVGLVAEDAGRRPRDFSGGQRQRIAIARALAAEPSFIICDEPTSALDVSVQAQVINLLRGLQRRLGLAYLLISHNLAVVAQMADRIGVMYLGRIVEEGPAARVIGAPRHPYTRLLLETVPRLDAPGRVRAPLGGEVPSPLAPPPGCAFHPRCPHAAARCAVERPLLRADGLGQVACHAVEEGRLPTHPGESS